jgi:hypothetical protein
VSIAITVDRRGGDGPDPRDHGERTTTVSQYLVLIYGNESAAEAAGEKAWQELHTGHMEFGAKNEQSIAGGNALQSVSTATSIRSNGKGDFVVTDGPFAETKEALGGYYLIEAEDLDEAIAVAKQVPAPFGGVEVRPIRVIG